MRREPINEFGEYKIVESQLFTRQRKVRLFVLLVAAVATVIAVWAIW